MERDRGLNFKLWVPPRVNNGPTSAVRPQEVVESCGDFMNPLQQGYSRCFDKGKNMPFPTTSMVTPSKSISQDFPKIKVVPPLEKYENNCNPGQLCSKLFDEVEKIKSWKVKVDSDTVQRERRLHENKRTIETQRKAIQELQFGNESLSIKLEEQIGENEDLRNKNNATRNLCNILKDTFEQSAEKMQLFESEREETHHLFVENCERIQKLTAAFESLWIRVESDKEEMQKVKEGLLQLDELKEKCFQEYNMKEEEVAELQLKLKNKDNELQNILHDLHETQKHCRQLEEATNQQYEVLQSSKAEQKSLLQKLQASEQSCEVAEKNRDAAAAALRQREEEYAQTIQSKDLSLQELSRVKNQQAEKLEQIQTTIKELQNSLSIQTQSTKELEEKLIANNEELERKDTLLKETMEQSAKKDGQIRILEDELDMRLKSIESMKGKIDITEITVEELTAKLSRKAEEINIFKNEAEMVFAENELLKKACEAAEKAQDDLKKKSTITENKVQELEAQLFTEIKKNEEHAFKMEQLRNDRALHKVKYEGLLSNFNELQSEKMAIQQQFESGSSHVKAIEADIKVSEEKAVRLVRENQKLKEENQHFREEINCIKTKVQEKCQETETLQKKIDKNCQLLQEKIIGKEKQIKILETKVCNLREKVKMKLEAQEKYQKENKLLKKQIAKETAKSSQLENEICSLHDESQNLEKVSEEVKQKLLKDLEQKSTLAAELENEIQKLRLSSAEAIKNKEDAELKCHHKIADMVALMEKHKSQYDRMVEEKDAELDETKKKEVEAVAQKKELELDLTKHKTENDELRKQLKIETTNKENLQKELTDLKKEMSSMKITQLAEAGNKQAPASKCEHRRFSDTPKESASKRHIYDCFKTRRTPSSLKDKESAAVMRNAESDNESLRTSRGTTSKTKDIHTEDVKTPSMTNKAGGTSKIKSYRIRTPPSTDKAAGWGKGAIEFDPKSDSSDQNDLLSFVNAPTPDVSNPHCECNTVKKIQSPVSHKSPGNSLKLAAMKRMRDAGWTAVTGGDKKKKMNNEKIFA